MVNNSVRDHYFRRGCLILISILVRKVVGIHNFTHKKGRMVHAHVAFIWVHYSLPSILGLSLSSFAVHDAKSFCMGREGMCMHTQTILSISSNYDINWKAFLMQEINVLVRTLFASYFSLCKTSCTPPHS